MSVPVNMNISLNKEVHAFVTKSHVSIIDNNLLQRFTELTSLEPRRLSRRGIVFSHRDLGTILDKYSVRCHLIFSPDADQTVMVYILGIPYRSSPRSMLAICHIEMLAIIQDQMALRCFQCSANHDAHR